MLTCVAEDTAVGDVVMAAPDDLETTAPLRVSHRICPTGETVVEFSGDLDIATAQMAVSYVRDVIASQHGRVTLDLSTLAFCDACGLGALVGMAGYAEQKGCSFRLASPSPSLIKIMRITGLDHRFLTSQTSPPGQAWPR